MPVLKLNSLLLGRTVARKSLSNALAMYFMQEQVCVHIGWPQIQWRGKGADFMDRWMDYKTAGPLHSYIKGPPPQPHTVLSIPIVSSVFRIFTIIIICSCVDWEKWKRKKKQSQNVDCVHRPGQWICFWYSSGYTEMSNFLNLFQVFQITMVANFPSLIGLSFVRCIVFSQFYKSRGIVD